MPSRKLRVGFDLDGVLLYNPARIVRPLVVFVKQRFLHITKTKFYVPSSPLEQWIWKVFHYSSLFTAPGLKEIKKLVEEDKIEAYIITGRYGFLFPDFETWLKKIDATHYFKKSFINSANEQPHLFKIRTVKELDLDIFVEDNWDIVDKLNQATSSTLPFGLAQGGQATRNCKVFWIYNVLDRGIKYEYKFPTLRKAVAKIEALTKS